MREPVPYMEIDLDSEYRERLIDRAERKGFESAETYAAVIVESVLDELESESDGAVRDRLEDLGYL